MNNIKININSSLSMYAPKIAIKQENLKITYSQLNTYVKSTMNKINSVCDVRNKCVVLRFESPIDMIVAQLSVLLLDGICMPLDYTTPLNY